MHITAKPLSKYPIFLRCYFYFQKRKIGKVLLPGLLWGRVPVLQVLFLLFWKYLDRRKSKLDPALRALVQVRVAQLNSCKFCVDYNSLSYFLRTNSMSKVESLESWRNSFLFTDVDKNVLEYAEIVSGMNVNVPVELMKKLKSHFSEEQIVELTALISFQNMSAKFNSALDIPSQGMCKLS